MNTKLMTLVVALSACSAAHASTALSFQNLNGVLVSSGEYISPYAGTLAGTPVTLFCDDFNDNIPVPSNSNVNISTPNGNLSSTRFATTNYNPAYPSGTTLYEEMAWLFTQMMSPGQTQANEIGIQEAVWHMTASTPGSVSTTSLSNTGSNLTYLQWITDAASDYNKAVGGFSTPNYSNWMILTDVANATTKTQGTGDQELFAYYSSQGVPTSNQVSSTPEPGTISMFAIGLGLMLAGMKMRARTGRKTPAGYALRG
jgi:hypothetical protein